MADDDRAAQIGAIAATTWIARQRARITERLTKTLVRIYRGFETYHYPDAVDFSEQVAPLVRGTQRAMADVTAEYITETARREFDRPGLQTAPVPDYAVVETRGVPTEEVYRRPFEEVWNELKRADDEADRVEEAARKRLRDAVDKGEDRLRAIADEDLQTAYANAAKEAMNNLPAQVQPEWWRRVPQGTYTCGLCLLTSTRVYRKGQLNPIHPACDCLVVPQYTPRPDYVIDEDLLNQVHERVAAYLGYFSASGRPELPGQLDYRDLLFEMTEDHGELGAMLVRPRKRKKSRF